MQRHYSYVPHSRSKPAWLPADFAKLWLEEEKREETVRIEELKRKQREREKSLAERRRKRQLQHRANRPAGGALGS
jgi:hypothetical protein